jgi:purine-nucleoside phosphorylase
MVITDHIKFIDNSPLRGPNVSEFGPRFNELSNAYTKELQRKTFQVGKELKIPLVSGVYALMAGPSFESPAEIRMLRLLGADAVGMSTVPEVITAAHAGMRILGISCITNMAAGILDKALNHEEVMETGARVSETFASLIRGVLAVW